MKKNIVTWTVTILYLFISSTVGLASEIYNFQNYVGSGQISDVDGISINAGLAEPYGIFHHEDHGVLFLDSQNNKIKKLNEREVTTFSGNYIGVDNHFLPIGGYRDGTLEEARFNKPRAGVVDSEGNIYIADSENHVIRKIIGDMVYTFSGSGQAGYKDGDANEAMFNLPIGLAIDDEGYLYVADAMNNVIRKVDRGGNVETFAGAFSEEGGFRNGKLNESMFKEPNDIVLGNDGAMYISDSGNNLIRIIKDNIVRTYAGINPEKNIYSDSVSVKKVESYKLQMNFKVPKGLFMSKEGILFIVDTGNNSVRAIGGNGKVVTIAQNNSSSSDVLYPSGVYMKDEILYVTDTYNNKIKRIQINNQEILKYLNEYDRFLDIEENNWFYKDVMDLYLEGLVSGYRIENELYFKPQNSINIDEFITMSMSSIGYSNLELGKEYWAENVIKKARELGIINEGEFNNYRVPIKREEMMMIISRTIRGEYSSDYENLAKNIIDFKEVEDYYKESVLTVFSKNIVRGYPDGSFRPQNNLTRAEAVIVITRMLEYFDNILKP